MSTSISQSSETASTSPVVGVIMGSSSDWDVMQHAVNMLKDFDIPCEARVISAHRMPQDMAEYGAAAAERGLRAIIAGAGGADPVAGDRHAVGARSDVDAVAREARDHQAADRAAGEIGRKEQLGNDHRQSVEAEQPTDDVAHEQAGKG